MWIIFNYEFYLNFLMASSYITHHFDVDVSIRNYSNPRPFKLQTIFSSNPRYVMFS